MRSSEDPDNGMAYRISYPTDEYLIFLLAKVSAISTIRMLRTPIMMNRIRRFREELLRDNDIFNALRIVIPRLLTVRVDTKKTKSFQELSRHSNAFLFQLTYNLDIPIVESRYLDDLVRSGRIISGRRSRLEDIEAPKRLYVPDLLYHYQMAVATDSPSHEYLSYYHVAEHFFEEVYNDDLINSVRNKLTQPGFSYRRKKDVQDLIRDINRRLRIRDETVTINEQEALRLTIQKYIDYDDLLDRLRSYDPSLIDYYRNTVVDFSEGIQVDLENRTSSTSDLLAKRIYRTRNSIVHSKEGEKRKYVPFEHDKILIREVPLLRFIAEGIIIETSTLVN